MQLLVGIVYDAKPENVTVYPSCVDVVMSCTEIQVEDKESKEKQTKYQCDVERYEVHEYIDKLQNVNADLAQQMTDTQVALCDVYEMIAGLM